MAHKPHDPIPQIVYTPYKKRPGQSETAWHDLPGAVPQGDK